MSTRTTGKRETLEERCAQTWRKKTTKLDGIVRAELDRLAGQVRKQRRELRSLLHPGELDERVTGRIEALNNVLAMIKERKK